ncbi:hypothetical protein BIV57_13290 [Mangrovactinospora gilvigrisea]|uniref:DUF2637 domain-containing protein n=1 Tax=Mangrovactinospora gilvigrisea TaxID=1428644 RepID=A0A1J7CBE3_9ACTN|nr:DUF2637 domain-containing protein [Mangrovactinospora gilvigrisea]OIV36962.1 hypothetical protein BIV57_13290 [Mangrovactinospora gilvigrisea]
MAVTAWRQDPQARPATTVAGRWRAGRAAAAATVGLGALAIAAIGGVGSYTALRAMAVQKGFGAFATVYPLALDVAVTVILCLDVVLTWLKLPYRPLRYTAWLLTVATVVLNGALDWPDPIGTAMHAVLPILPVIVVEAARHALAAASGTGRPEAVRLIRWVLAPRQTWRIWRCMQLWQITSLADALEREQRRALIVAELRDRHGRRWRHLADVAELRPLRLLRLGLLQPDSTPACENPADPLPTIEQESAPPQQLPRAADPAGAQTAERAPHPPSGPSPAAADASRVAPPANGEESAVRPGSKKQRAEELYLERQGNHRLLTRRELADRIDLSEGTARRYFLDFERAHGAICADTVTLERTS